MNHIKSIKTKNSTVRYSYFGNSTPKELSIIDSSIRGAYHMSLECLSRIGKGGEESVKHFSVIFGEVSPESVAKVTKSFNAIISKINKGFRICRKDIFTSKAGTKEASTLSSAIPDENIIFIYDAFFKSTEGDEKGLNARSSVLMHEFGHLAGLRGDAETGSFNSPECLRNYALLECKIVSAQDLFNGKNSEKRDGDDSHKNTEIGQYGELPFNPNQPRVPKGSPEGGQFAAVGGTFGSDNSKGAAKENPSLKPEAEKLSSTGKVPESKSREWTSAARNEGTIISDKAKSELNLQAGGVKVNEKDGNWCAGNIDIEGLEEYKEHTVVVEIDYEVKDKDGNSIKENAKIAMDALSDDEGKINIWRVGIVGEYNHENNKFTTKSNGLEIDVKVSVAPGTVEENYGKPETAGFNDLNVDASIKAQKDKYGLGYYGVAHATQEKWLNDANKPVGYSYNGGSVAGREDPNDLKEIGKSKIKFDNEKHKINPKESTIIEGGKNTASGRY